MECTRMYPDIYFETYLFGKNIPIFPMVPNKSAWCKMKVFRVREKERAMMESKDVVSIPKANSGQQSFVLG